MAHQAALQQEQLVVGQPPAAERVLDHRVRGWWQATSASRRSGSLRADRISAGIASGRSPAWCSCSSTSVRSRRDDTASLAGYTGTRPLVCSVSARSSTSSWLLATISASIVERRSPADREPHLGFEVLGQVALVEPHHHTGARAVVHDGLDDHQVAPPRWPRPYPVDRHHNGGLLPRSHVRQRPAERKSSWRNGTCSSRSPTERTGGAALPGLRRAPSAGGGGASRCEGEGAELGRGNAGLSRPSNDLMRRARSRRPNAPGSAVGTRPPRRSSTPARYWPAVVRARSAQSAARRCPAPERAPARPAQGVSGGTFWSMNRSNSRHTPVIPRTFLYSTTSPSRIVSIGFSPSASPSRRRVRVMRPPRSRYSSVLTPIKILHPLAGGGQPFLDLLGGGVCGRAGAARPSASMHRARRDRRAVQHRHPRIAPGRPPAPTGTSPRPSRRSAERNTRAQPPRSANAWEYAAGAGADVCGWCGSRAAARRTRRNRCRRRRRSPGRRS